MLIPSFTRRRAMKLSWEERLRRESKTSQLAAVSSSAGHYSAEAGRDVDGQSGSANGQLTSRGSQELPGSWVGAPDYNNISWLSVSIIAYGKQMKATPFIYGGGPITVIPSNQPFAGRESGGGTRAEVYGNSYYGSGYPGEQSCSVHGRGFPFVFWPVIFTAPAKEAGAAYLYGEVEYGGTDNSTRPGAALQQSMFYTNRSTFRLITDTTTSTYLYYAITGGCASSVNSLQSHFPTTYNSTSNYGRPEQAVQYYRASSVVLTLDGYNNSVVLNDTEPVRPPTPLPLSIDNDLLKCINATIGASVPLVGSAGPTHDHPATALFILIWLILFFF